MEHTEYMNILYRRCDTGFGVWLLCKCNINMVIKQSVREYFMFRLY